LQFDPGIVTRAEVQREMVQALEATHTRMVIESTTLDRRTEAFNASSRPGATIFDDYLRERFAPFQTIGGYRVLWRREP
jgi:hypothetical protein